MEDRITPATLFVDNPGDFIITTDQGAPGLDNGDTVTWNPGAGSAHGGPVTNLTFGTNAFGTIQNAINAAVSGADTIRVAGGTFTEALTLNKSVGLLGNQTGVDARGRVVGAPNPATETVVSPPVGRALELQDLADNAIVDGFAFVGSLSGAVGVIESTTGPTDNLQLLNNYVAVAPTFTASALFLNRSAVDATISGNEFIKQTSSAQAVFFDGPDLFHGMHFTNNNVLNSGAVSGTGLFIDGNHNWSISPSLRTPLMQGNRFEGFNTGANLGSRSFGSLATPNAGEIRGNLFTNNAFDGLQGGPQHVLITQNTFSNNGRSGLALTSFGNTGADRGAQNNSITENFFAGNGATQNGEDVFFSASQAVGTIATNRLFNNSLLSTNAVTYNGTETIQASGNWWGNATGPTVSTNPGGTGQIIRGTGAANVDFSPWLHVGADTAGGTPGFQGDFSWLHVEDTSPQSTFLSAAAGRIQEAVNLLADGSLVGGARRIDVGAGTYSELVIVDKSATLAGAQAGVDARTRTAVPESIVNGTVINTPNRTTAFNITASNSTLDGFTVRDQNDGNVFNAGIVMASTTSGVTVRNNIITNNAMGIYAGSSGASLIERNLIDGNNTEFDGNGNPIAAAGAGIYTENTVGLTIDDNEFRNHTVNNPIIFATVSGNSHTNLTVSDNFIHDNVSGIFALGINGGVFLRNTISTAGTATGLTFGGSNTGIDVLNNDLSGNLRGLRIADFGFLGVTPNSDIEAHFNSFANNAMYGAAISDEGSGLTDGYTGTLDLTCNWWGDVTGPTTAANPGGSGTVLRNDFADIIVFQPWLLYNDASATQVGFQVPTTFTVNAQTTTFTPTNNNYRRLVNAIECLQPGQTVILSGNFDWTEANALASWGQGNDGVASTADDFTLTVRPNLNNVTITAASLGSARIQGPGDLAAANLEGVFNFEGGDNQNWLISNLEIFDFDLAIGMFNGAGGSDAYNNTTIANNRIRIANDLNSVVAPIDVNQNIGIHYSFGTNQNISGNQIDIPGDGISDPSANLISNRAAFSNMVGMQSNTSGGAVYDGLLITNNTIRVLNAQNATNPQRIIGIWDNGHAHSSTITISQNQFVNLAAGNNPAANLQQAFWVTSHSSASSTVTYLMNTVSGANIGFKWIGDPEFPGTSFAGNQPVAMTSNTLTNVQTGFLVQSNGRATFSGNNSVTGSGAAASVGIDVRQGSRVSVLGGSFTGSGIGIDVDGTLRNAEAGTALIQNANLNFNTIAGLRARNGAQVDAGGGGYTGLGTSTGGNDFSEYGLGGALAIQDLNTDAGFTGMFVSAPPDMRAQNNIFASASAAFIEQVVNHDVDVATQGFVDFGGAQAGVNNPPVANSQNVTTAEDTPKSITLTGSSGDPVPQTLTFAITSGPFFGTVTNFNSATGQFTYVPNLNYNGSDSFTFTVTDDATAGNPPNLTSAPATVNINVTAVADFPVIVANPANQSITAGGTAFFSAGATLSSAMTVQWQVSSNGGATWSTLSNGGNFSGVNTTTLVVGGALTNLSGLYFRAVFTNTSEQISTASAAASLIVRSAYLQTINATANSAYIAAYYAYATSGGNSNAYAAFVTAYYAASYAAYADYYSSIGQTATANYYASQTQYYSYLSAYYSYLTYIATGNNYAYYAYYYAYSSSLYTAYVAQGY